MILLAKHCPPNTFSYTIEAGDTPYSISQEYNTTVSAINSANPEIKPDNLQIGQQICIPQQKRYPPCPEGNYYTIKSSDSLYAIARRFNISIDDLREANPYIEPENLQNGEVICIPVATPPVDCPRGTRSYTIKAGDTFYSLARKYNITVDKIKQLNPEIKPDAILIGQKICLPQID